jgi:hypothetical protein
MVTPRPRAGTHGGPDLFEGNKLAFCLGDYFVFHDQNVARSRREFEMLESLEKFICQRVAGTDFIRERDWNNTKL